MCMNGGSEKGSGGTTNVTTTDKNFDKSGGGGNNNNSGSNKAQAAKQSSAPVQTSENRTNGASIQTPTYSDLPYNSEERMRGDALRDTRGINDKGKDKDKGGGGKDKDKGGGGGGGGGGKGGNGGGGGGGKKVENKYYSSTIYNIRKGIQPLTMKGNNGSGSDTFASGARDITSESPRKNNLTLSSKAKNASLRPSLVF